MSFLCGRKEESCSPGPGEPGGLCEAGAGVALAACLFARRIGHSPDSFLWMSQTRPVRDRNVPLGFLNPWEVIQVSIFAGA